MLQLTDPSLTIEPQGSAALGNGFRCGFLGLLHMDVVLQRLEDEHDCEATLTSPNVSYICKLRNGESTTVNNPLEAPDLSEVKYYMEPMANVNLIVPSFSTREIVSICENKRGIQKQYQSVDGDKYFIKYEMPLSEIITDFFDVLKSSTKGLGSMDFEFSEYQQSSIQKMVILIMGEAVDALSFMVHRDQAEAFGKKICQKLKQQMPGEQFTVVIQAKFGNKIVAREEIKSHRKDVTAKCYGGDYSRKKKLLEKQKKGKDKMRTLGSVNIKKDTFKNILRMN